MIEEKKKRTRKELVIAAFRYMYLHGELSLHESVIPCSTGGVFVKTFWKVKR